jgi:DNA polymerase-1
VLSRDYKSIEVVVAAAIAQDEALIEVLKHADSHTMVASLVFGIPPEQVTKTQRSLAKAMSFTLIFGGGARTLWIYAHRYGASITIEEAKGLITKFFSRFKGLAKMRSIAYRKAQEYNDQLAQGKWPMPITISLPQGLKRQLTQDKAAATVILNTSVQGSAAAGLKEAIRLLRDWNMHHYLAAVVHDEIIMIVPEELAPEYDKALDEAMVQGMIRMIGDAVPVVSSVALNDDGTYPTHWSK